MSEGDDITTMANTLQRYAEQFARSNPDRSTHLHHLAREIARELEVSRRLQNRSYYCMFCKPSRTLGEAPDEGCKVPLDHIREDGTRYVEEPPMTVLGAVLTFVDEHFGLPWFERCERDESRGVLVVFTRAPVPQDALPSQWKGYQTEARFVSRNNNTVCCESGCPNLATGTRWRVGGWQPCCAACGGETFTPWPAATVKGGDRGC